MFTRNANRIARQMATALKSSDWAEAAELIDDLHISSISEWRNLRRWHRLNPNAPVDNDNALYVLKEVVEECKRTAPVGVKAVGLGVMEILLIIEAVIKLVELIRQFKGRD